MALNTFIAEVTLHDGKVEQHGIGVGGVPNMTAQEVADHLTKLDHFQGKAKKVVIKHRSALVRKTVGDIIKDKPRITPAVEVEVHPDANSDHPNLNELPPQKTTPTVATVEDEAALNSPVK